MPEAVRGICLIHALEGEPPHHDFYLTDEECAKTTSCWPVVRAPGARC
jgi:hypothetical protein